MDFIHVLNRMFDDRNIHEIFDCFFYFFCIIDIFCIAKSINIFTIKEKVWLHFLGKNLHYSIFWIFYKRCFSRNIFNRQR